MLKVNTHSHTTYCGHAESTLADMVSAADGAGLDIFAITEHYPLIEPFDSWGYISMPYMKLDDYLAEIEAHRLAHPNMTILSGCEVDWLGSYEGRNLAGEDWSRFDVILGSVHFIDDWGFDDPALMDRWETLGVDQAWRSYFKLWIDAVSSDAPFTVMAHPDLIKKFSFYPGFDPLPLYKDAAEACAAAGRMIEVNTSGRFYPCREFFPGPDLLREFCKAGVPCTVGTDAHAAANVDRCIEDAYAYMYEAGYRKLTVPTAGRGRMEIEIA